MIDELLRWAIFTVIVSLIPFMMIAVGSWSAGVVFAAASLWPRGELLLVSTAIAADAVGDLVGRGKKKVETGSMLIFVSTVIAALGCKMFAED